MNLGTGRPGTRVPCAAAAFGAFVLSSAVFAQKPPLKELPPIGETVTVSVTNVEVVVTDSRGHRVSGLTKNDFEVYEDGVPQPLTNFYAVSGGKVTLDDGTVLSLHEAVRTEEVPATLKVKYVIYVDNLNIDPLHRNRVIEKVQDFARRTIGPQAEGMVVTFNRSLKVRRKFTSEPGDIVATLEQIKTESGGGTTIVSERRDAIQAINDAQSATEALARSRQTARAIKNDLQFSIDAIKTTITGLAGIEGRKSLIYVSDGLPQIAGDELFDTVQRKFPDQGSLLEKLEFEMSAAYVSVIREANAQGVTISAIDATGLAVDSLITAENRSLDVRPSPFQMAQNLQAPLRQMAEETGGLAAVNVNDPSDALKEIAEDFSTFYSLGYRSKRGGTDRPHSIEVRVKRKGLKIRYRRGYVEKTVETQTAEAVVASLHYPRMDNPLAVALTSGEPKGYEDNYLVPLRIVVPLRKLQFVPEGDAQRGRVYFYFVVLDADGKQSDLQIRPLDLKIPAKDFEKEARKDYEYSIQLLMGPGYQRLAVAVRDGVSNLVSYVQKNLFISVLPKNAKAGS